MKSRWRIRQQISVSGRAPQGARGLKSFFTLSPKALVRLVAPRKGRVG